jgi:hypothetical protein
MMNVPHNVTMIVSALCICLLLLLAAFCPKLLVFALSTLVSVLVPTCYHHDIDIFCLDAPVHYCQVVAMREVKQ